MITKNIDFNDLAKIQFENLIDIKGFLQEFNVMNTTSIEWWIISTFLHSIALNSNAPFEFIILKPKCDPPDFSIIFHLKEINIEVVRALDSKYEEASSYCNKNQNLDSFPINTDFIYGVGKNKSKWKNHFQRKNEPLKGAAIYGDLGRHHTANLIIQAIANKVEKYKSKLIFFHLLVYVETPSKIYCNTQEDKTWILHYVGEKIKNTHLFLGVYLLWDKEHSQFIENNGTVHNKAYISFPRFKKTV